MKRREILLAAPAIIAARSALAVPQGVSPPVLPLVGPCKFGSIQTRMPFWGYHGVSSGGYSLGAVFTAESDFDFVRLVYANMDTSSHVITSAAVAASSSLNDTANPMNAAGTADNTLWTLATFNNAGAPGDIPSPAGTTRTATMAAAVQGSLSAYPASDRVATLTFGDWIPLQSLARLDVPGGLPLIFVRTYAAAGMDCAVDGAVLGESPTGGGAWDAYASGRIVRAWVGAGDQATAPGTFTPTPIGYLAPSAVQFLSRKRGLACLVVGDSLFQGAGTISYGNDPFQIAAASLSTPGFPIMVCKAAYQSMGSASFQANGYTFAAGLEPDVVFIKGESPNDAPQGTAATYENSLARCMAFADWCTRQGIVPVLCTAEPWGYSGTAEANRLSFNAAIRASGWLFMDWDAVLTNGASPAVILPAFTSSAAPPHYNDAGSAALAKQTVAPILQRIMANRPH